MTRQNPYLMCPRISKLLCESEVDGVDQVALLAEPHEEVVRLDVAVDEVLAVDELDAADLEKTLFMETLHENVDSLRTHFVGVKLCSDDDVLDCVMRNL